MGQSYSAPVDNYRRSSKKAAKKLGFLHNKTKVLLMSMVAHRLGRVEFQIS